MRKQQPVPVGDGFDATLAYLFYGLDPAHDVLNESTYIFDILNSESKTKGLSMTRVLGDDIQFVSRWPENKFPLKIFISPDYGVLFSPGELKQLRTIIGEVVGEIEAINPDQFRFTYVSQRHQADIVMLCRRDDKKLLHHTFPALGAEKELTYAEITLTITTQVSHDSVRYQVMHQLLHALGMLGHSDNPFDSGYITWNPQQALLTPRDIATLRLLYRCPIGMSESDLKLLWDQYQARYPGLKLNAQVQAVLGNPNQVPTPMPAMFGTATLSAQERQLQESVRHSLRHVKTA